MPRAQERLPIPSEQELQGWIPSQRFPSDHLSLVFDFAWRDSGGNAASCAGQVANSQSLQAQPDGVPGNGAAPESSRREAPGKALNNSSLPAYHSDGLLEHSTDQQAVEAAIPCSKQPASRGQQQQSSVTGGDGQSSSFSVEAADAPAIEGSHAAQGLVLPAAAAQIPAAAAALARGEIVALPTDTLYGLAACAYSQQVGYVCSYRLPSACCACWAQLASICRCLRSMRSSACTSMAAGYQQ